LLLRVDDAAVIGARVDVKTDGTLLPFGWIVDLVDRFAGIDGARIRQIHFYDIGRLEVAGT
jgi:hypothetical protein